MRITYSTTRPSPVGKLTLTCTEEGITGLWIEGQKYFGASVPEIWEKGDDHPLLMAAGDWLDRYFAGCRPSGTELPLCPSGSPYRQAVWAVLREIPYGEVTTYGEVAERAALRLGEKRGSARAAGNAVGHNPISILIPCHRVIGADGSLTGYAGGLSAKRKLLALEGYDPDRHASRGAETDSFPRL